MSLRRNLRIGIVASFLVSILLTAILAGAPGFALAQKAPPPEAARALLLPRKIVSGERATLAVLDGNGRLTPDVTIQFSNGDTLKTDPTGRALFVAPLDPGVIFATMKGRPGRVSTVVLTPAEAAANSMEISAAPQAALVTDRFEVSGKGFCGDADSNQMKVGGLPALILASSPVSLVVLPPNELKLGPARVGITCGRNVAPPFQITFVELALEADSSPLKPGERRTLTVRVRGTSAKVAIEARNLDAKIAELAGGAVVKQSSSGGANNAAKFTLAGRARGSFSISVRLVPAVGSPRPPS